MPSDDGKMKKEVVESDDDEACLGAMLQNRKKKISAKVNARSKVVKVKAEQQEVELEDDVDTKPILKKKTSSTKTVKKVEVKKVKVEEKTKKVYDLPGQKRDTPEERDPARIFYETLLKQVPDSEMAQFWMMESGLFSEEVAMKIFEKKQQKKSQKKLSSLTKAVKKSVSPAAKKKTLSSTPVSSNKEKSTDSKAPSRKRKIKKESSDDDDGNDDNDSDDDFVAKRPAKKKKKAN